ncbi:cell division protein FtsZ [Aestuariivirga litoralis]|uniref:cell division protein FtsZ n=1 Tax=Aestuariivirga litoralis TaxID=2650924 RepID=UPI0018C7C548|nr:cell division protein FtsZ [Aestuariivirga litoralis]MBG1231949.1 cell division protein FtsZ [Aestuariivirga litoralis]
MTIKLTVPNLSELKPRITVFGVGGAGGNAVNNMIESRLEGVEFVVANTDAQALLQNAATRRIQMGTALTQGLGAGSHPQIGAAAAEEALQEIVDHLAGSHMAFITAGMGGGTGTGAAPVIARAAKEQGILTVGVVTKPFHFEGVRRQSTAEAGIEELARYVDTLIVIPNQNLFRVANEKTTFAAAFAMADQVLYSGVASITELMTKEGLINLDFADVRAIMSEMGKAMMGTGEASGDRRAIEAAEAAISNPLLDDVSMRGARGLLISICGGPDLTLYEVDEAATRIREEVDPNANIILGATFDETLEGTMRVSVVATGLNIEAMAHAPVREEIAEPVKAERKTYSIPQPSSQARANMRANPIPPMMELEEAAMEETHEAEMEQEEAPVAHVPASRANPRIPPIEQFPRIAQEQVAAQQQRISEIATQANKKRSIFDRLANVGLGRRSEPQIETEAAPQAPSRRAEPRIQRTPAPAYQEPAPMQPEASYDDDQLAIPAFLRRQAAG